MNNNETIESLLEKIVMQTKEEEGEIAIAMKMAREVPAERKTKKNGELEVQQLQRRRNEITILLQRCGISISSLQSLSIKESRHEENCQVIPEGNENEDEDTDVDYDDDDSVVKSSSKTLTLDQDDSDSDSNTDSNCNCEIENGTAKQKEQQRRRRNNVFHRMKRRFVVAKNSVVVSTHINCVPSFVHLSIFHSVSS